MSRTLRKWLGEKSGSVNRAADGRFLLMPQRLRPRRVQVKLDEAEYELLTARAAQLGISRSGFVRDALRTATAEGSEELDRAEVLGLLARAGSTAALVALARELRPAPIRLEAVESERPVDELGRVRDLHHRLEQARR
jgi:hypothetical protein